MVEFRCKHCGSLNLELEEKGNQTGLYCCDCGKWLKWVTKEEKRVFNNKNICTPIYASKGATNGDMIKAMFPNGKEYDNDGDVRYEIEIDFDYSYCSYFDGVWWNAPYKRGSEKE